MKAMWLLFSSILLVSPVLGQAQSPNTTKACGDTNINFVVAEGHSQPIAAQPKPGQAEVYFILDDGPQGDK